MTKTIGERLKDARISAGLSVQDVSTRMIESGFEKASAKTIYSWESGNSKPATDYFLELCAIYELNDILTAFGYKKTPKSENSDSGVLVNQDQVLNVLIDLGFVKDGKTLSNRDVRFLKSIISLIEEWFKG